MIKQLEKILMPLRNTSIFNRYPNWMGWGKRYFCWNYLCICSCAYLFMG